MFYKSVFLSARLNYTQDTVTARNLDELCATVTASNFRRLEAMIPRFDLSTIYLFTTLNIVITER